MNLSPSALLTHAKSPQGRKQLRYAGVSLVFVPVGQILIQVLGRFVFDRNYTAASIAAAAILTIPNFLANKYFVWKETSRDNLRTQILVFWTAAFIGISFATGLTWITEQITKDKAEWIEAGAVFIAQMIGFGVVWVGRYLILDRWLFKVTHHGEPPDDDEIEMLRGDLPI